MKKIAIALVLVIPLAGCHPAVVVCSFGEWGQEVCSGPDYRPPLLWVDSQGRIIQDYAAGGDTIVPGEYLITLAADAEVKTIADLYGQFGIKNIKDLGHFRLGTYRLFVVGLTEDPGPARMQELRRENAQFFAVQPNYVYRGSIR